LSSPNQADIRAHTQLFCLSKNNSYSVCKIVCFPSLFLFISYSYSELFIFIRIQKRGEKEEEDPRAAAGLHDEYKRGRTMPFDASNAKPFMCSGVFGAPLCWVLDGARDVCTSKG
jgi:hypothetical protein